jgi:hypothetical protein
VLIEMVTKRGGARGCRKEGRLVVAPGCSSPVSDRSRSSKRGYLLVLECTSNVGVSQGQDVDGQGKDKGAEAGDQRRR